LSEIALALVYFDVASQSEVELRQVFGAEELEEMLARRCEAFLAWARKEATHRDARGGTDGTDVPAGDLPCRPARPRRSGLAEAVRPKRSGT